MDAIWTTTVTGASDADTQLVETLIPAEFRKVSATSSDWFVRVCDFTRKAAVAEADGEFKTVVDMSGRLAGERKLHSHSAAHGRGAGRGGWTARPAAGEATGGQSGRGGMAPRQRGGRGGGGGGWHYHQQFQQYQQQQQQEAGRVWSMEPQVDWQLVKELPLVSLSKLGGSPGAVSVKSEDLVWCGELREYDKQFEKLMARTGGRDVKKTPEETTFYNVTASQDSVLEQLVGRAAAGSTGKTVVGCTDKVLAALMTSARSVNPFDLVFTKEEDMVMIDKRDFSPFDLITANETHPSEAPPFDGEADKLAHEATMLNQWFSQMPLGATPASAPVELAYGNPFTAEEDEKTAAVAYRYRKMEVGDKHIFVLRAEVNAVTSDGKFATLRALNEVNVKTSGNWKSSLDAQRGALLATEIKNNSFKFGRWVAEASLAGCEQIKLGYITKKTPSLPNYSLLNVQSLTTPEIANQIGFSMNNAWSVVLAVLDLINNATATASPNAQAKFILLKDPKKSALRLYQVPFETVDFTPQDAEDIDE